MGRACAAGACLLFELGSESSCHACALRERICERAVIGDGALGGCDANPLRKRGHVDGAERCWLARDHGYIIGRAAARPDGELSALGAENMVRGADDPAVRNDGAALADTHVVQCGANVALLEVESRRRLEHDRVGAAVRAIGGARLLRRR